MAEISVGFLLGPSILGYFNPDYMTWLFPTGLTSAFGLLKELGLIMLMFCSGAELRHLNPRNHKKECFYGVLLGIGLPGIVGGLILAQMDLSSLIGAIGNHDKLNSILLLSMAVTSIPVISRILFDLNLLQTRFSQIVLSIALIEDFILYAFLNAIVGSDNSGSLSSLSVLNHVLISSLFLSFIIFFRVQLFSFFRMIAKATTDKDSVQLYMTYTLAALFLFIWLSGHLGIINMISAFCAGMILGSGTSRTVELIITSIKELSFALFIPFYFIMVGLQIDLFRDFNLRWFLFFFLISSVLKTSGGYLTGILTKHSRIRSLALGVTLNARGGPGIVIATAALEAKIINTSLFATLILTAIATSSLAGFFLDKHKAVLID